MKEFENIGKKMPYQESPEYLNQLIERTTESAIQHTRRSPLRYAAAAAVAALLVFAGISIWSPEAEPQMAQTEMTSPVEVFLNNISDEDAQLLSYYEIDDMLEYE